ncbi:MULTISPECIES: nucleotide disphospho-sugar-binding domain-containing protein [Actinosynnema]|uniref:nucleotide disphospho-sugar-binding domain-containing protein n=1 Tax=Actinosynnema TaxID=40566 RepID=UPI0020A4ED2A|nr:nucleotide disphospho-sugar-binding domain-containing protein [Actinosynnema pretiosum]MCP2094512.1 UDP:flavonoid glycosyltransferase YjiC, YdhE family [Actinosynnema pretiosum]
MRVLFTPLPADPRLRGLAPLAQALRAAGHEVRVAVRPAGVPVVTGAGLSAAPVGDDAPTPVPVQGAPGSDAAKRLLHLDDALLDDLLDLAERWRPDLLVWDQAVLAGPVVAKILDLPHVRVPHAVDVIGLHRAALPAAPPDNLTTLLGEALALRGAVFTEDVAVGHLTVDQLPPGVRPPVDLDHLPLRHTPHDGPTDLPDHLREPPTRPRVCLALAHPDREGGLAPAERATAEVLVGGAALLDVEVVALLPAGTPPLPVATHPHDHEPPQELLRSCAAIVHRGDPTTTSAAALAGVPQLVAPGGGWDEPTLAALLAERGVALVLDRVAEEAVAEHLLRLLGEPGFAERAADLRAEALARPTPHDAVHRLEDLVAEHTGRVVPWGRGTRSGRTAARR